MARREQSTSANFVASRRRAHLSPARRVPHQPDRACPRRSPSGTRSTRPRPRPIGWPTRCSPGCGATTTAHTTTPTTTRTIWRRCLAHAPTEDLDLSFVADKFDLTGGSIRNCALTAAFIAAGGHHPIGMVDLLRGISQEMAKLGRRPNDDQFGRWLDDLKD